MLGATLRPAPASPLLGRLRMAAWPPSVSWLSPSAYRHQDREGEGEGRRFSQIGHRCTLTHMCSSVLHPRSSLFQLGWDKNTVSSWSGSFFIIGCLASGLDAGRGPKLAPVRATFCPYVAGILATQLQRQNVGCHLILQGGFMLSVHIQNR